MKTQDGQREFWDQVTPRGLRDLLREARPLTEEECLNLRRVAAARISELAVQREAILLMDESPMKKALVERNQRLREAAEEVLEKY